VAGLALWHRVTKTCSQVVVQLVMVLGSDPESKKIERGGERGGKRKGMKQNMERKERKKEKRKKKERKKERKISIFINY